jgi:hypothetical protein
MESDKFIQFGGKIPPEVPGDVVTSLCELLSILDASWKIVDQMVFGVFLGLLASTDRDGKYQIYKVLREMMVLLVAISDDFVDILRHPDLKVSPKMQEHADECLKKVNETNRGINLLSLTIASVHLTSMPNVWVDHIERLISLRVQVAEVGRALPADMSAFADGIITLHEKLVGRLSRKVQGAVFRLNSQWVRSAEEWAAVVEPKFMDKIAKGLKLDEAYKAVVQEYGAPWLDPDDGL